MLLCGCNDNKVQPTGVKITSQGNATEVVKDSTLQLFAAVYPEGSKQEVKWTSLDESVASVTDAGLVTGLDVGNVKIKAEAVANSAIFSEFALKVTPKPVVEVEPESITVTTTGDQTTLKAGETLKASATVLPAEASQEVVWSTSAPEILTVSESGILKGVAEGEATVTATSTKKDSVKGSLTIKVEKGEEGGDTGTTENWDDMAFSTHDEYINAEAASALKVKGTVTYIMPEKEGKASYYVQEGTSGYFIYNQDITTLPVELGKSYAIGGNKKKYNGTHEIVDVSYCTALNETLTYETTDVSQMNVSDLDAMAQYQGSWVKATAATVANKPTNLAKAFSLTVNINNSAIDLRVDPNYTTEEEFTAIADKVNLLSMGQALDVTGIMSAFGYGKAKNQIQVFTADALEVAQLTDEEMVEAAANALSLQNSIAKDVNSIDLPATVDGFTGVLISWTSNNPIINGSTGAVTHSSDTTDVTLTATVTLNDASLTKDFIVTVFADDEDKLEAVHTFDLEDALPASQYGMSASKPSYKAGNVELGTPKTTWLLSNAAIAGDGNDHVNGTFGIRTQVNAVQEESGRIEVLQDYEFSQLEFKAAIYGANALGVQLAVEYSTDSGTTFTRTDRVYTINSYSLETIRVHLPQSNATTRIAIVVLSGQGQRVNVDDIRFLKAK